MNWGWDQPGQGRPHQLVERRLVEPERSMGKTNLLASELAESPRVTCWATEGLVAATSVSIKAVFERISPDPVELVNDARRGVDSRTLGDAEPLNYLLLFLDPDSEQRLLENVLTAAALTELRDTGPSRKVMVLVRPPISTWDDVAELFPAIEKGAGDESRA